MSSRAGHRPRLAFVRQVAGNKNYGSFEALLTWRKRGDLRAYGRRGESKDGVGREKVESWGRRTMIFWRREWTWQDRGYLGVEVGVVGKTTVWERGPYRLISFPPKSGFLDCFVSTQLIFLEQCPRSGRVRGEAEIRRQGCYFPGTHCLDCNVECTCIQKALNMTFIITHPLDHLFYVGYGARCWGCKDRNWTQLLPSIAGQGVWASVTSCVKYMW